MKDGERGLIASGDPLSLLLVPPLQDDEFFCLELFEESLVSFLRLERFSSCLLRSEWLLLLVEKSEGLLCSTTKFCFE